MKRIFRLTLAALFCGGCADDGGSNPGGDNSATGSDPVEAPVPTSPEDNPASDSGAPALTPEEQPSEDPTNQGPLVPREVVSEAESVLGMPELVDDGLCPNAVLCNGVCLDAPKTAEGNCTLVALGLRSWPQVAISQTSLFYTLQNKEVVRMDLATGELTSLVTGLFGVAALAVAEGALYFSTGDPAGGLFEEHVRRVSVAGGPQLALSPPTETIPQIMPLKDRLLLGLGSFPPYSLATVSHDGGELTRLSAIRSDWTEVLNDELYYRENRDVHVTSLDKPMLGEEIRNTSSGAFGFAIRDGNLYQVVADAYWRLPVAGGPGEMLQELTEKTYIAAVVDDLVVLTQPHPEDSEWSRLLAMPVEGGEPAPIGGTERAVQSIVANDTHLFVLVDGVGTSGILRFER